MNFQNTNPANVEGALIIPSSLLTDGDYQSGKTFAYNDANPSPGTATQITSKYKYYEV